ncbi:4-diphosphocytidyl-2-C-methyl-D-erythritol kinase [Alkalibacillus filiformis]|uniref:4-diphosphocytidyl-2-C-methyl-D-erythritol kinase n=2 Tax=Alkalibacillus filiformis TaxID=200990 RepID=A0ABU0DW62_9BACI|nr:4-diphosphocytidyl-2-C-methyl-D-erythritol kinase [Alkalibacillus filiformis]
MITITVGENMIYEKAPAKINLTLDILHKREDGFHEVEMIMTSIDLSDRLFFEELTRDEIVIDSENRYVPNDHRNLAYQAAKVFKKQCGIRSGVKVDIDKNIPVAAGLAGGSSDAAATIRGLNRLFATGLSNAQMEKMAEQIGSDVPYCIQGGTQLAKGRGEVLTPLSPLPACYVVLAKPKIGVSTKEVYGRVDLNNMIHPNNEQAIKALENQDFQAVCEQMGNVLEPITMNMHKEISPIKEQMENADADGVLMSGSGPTVYALVKQQSKAERIYNSLKGFCEEVYVVHSLR